MHTELGETMPVCQIKEEREDMCVVGFRQKTLKNWYSTLRK